MRCEVSGLPQHVCGCGGCVARREGNVGDTAKGGTDILTFKTICAAASDINRELPNHTDLVAINNTALITSIFESAKRNGQVISVGGEDHKTVRITVYGHPKASSGPETKLREAGIALCDALAERWFEPGDTEAQTARAVAAHKVLSDLLMEGGGE